MKSSKHTTTMAVLVLIVAAVAWPPGGTGQTSNPNSFNRLMKPPSERNPPPAQDGIHDPERTIDEAAVETRNEVEARQDVPGQLRTAPFRIVDDVAVVLACQQAARARMPAGLRLQDQRAQQEQQEQ